MSDYMINVIGALLYLLLAPLLGGLLSGLDRKISARMQRRGGAPPPPPRILYAYSIARISSTSD